MSKTFKVMVVKDEMPTALDIQKILKTLGHTVTSISSSGEEGLRSLEELEKNKNYKNIRGNKPDFVLIDNVQSGKMNGMEVARQMRTRFNIPVVCLMDSIDEETLESTRETESFECILKPLGKKDFHASMGLVLNQHARKKKSKEKQEKLNLNTDVGGDSFLLFDSELNIVEIYKKGAENSRMLRKDLLGKNILDLIPDIQKSGRYDKFMKVMKAGESYFEECVATYPNAGDRFINLKGFKIGNGLGMIITDLTDQKKAEQTIWSSEERYRLLVENMNEGLIMLDENQIITCINERILKMNGFSKDRIIGQCVTDFLDRTSVEIFKDQVIQHKKGERGSCEVVWKKKDGGKVITTVSLAPIFDDESNFKGSIAVLTDITNHRQVEEELKRSHRQLRNLSRHFQSVREKESARIAWEIHDELGHLLTALKMDLSWIYKRLPKDQKPLLDTTRSMSKLTDMTIKTVQRISTELRPVILDDLGLIPAIEWHAQEFEGRTNIRCEVITDCRYNDLDQERSTALFRIFQEALTNVVRHANATKIKVGLKEKPGKLLLKIKDNGRGITEEQISNPKSFGLIGIRERIYPWGGEIKIKGISNKGTSLTVILPVEKRKKILADEK